MLKIKIFVFNPFQENTYLLWDANTKEALVADPGISNEQEEIEFSGFITQQELKVKYLLNTHCHIDHIIGNSFVKEKYGCKFYAPQKDIPLLQQLPEQTEMFGLNRKDSPMPDEYLEKDLILTLGESKINMIFTPGHTPGEFCFYSKEDKICISGDVLFKEGIGRTDLWGGNYQTLISSIQEKLFILPDDVKVYPGHGEQTSIGHEKNNNPFLT